MVHTIPTYTRQIFTCDALFFFFFPEATNPNYYHCMHGSSLFALYKAVILGCTPAQKRYVQSIACDKSHVDLQGTMTLHVPIQPKPL